MNKELDSLNYPGQALDFAKFGESIRASYRDVAAKYREDDEVEITTEDHRRLKTILGTISSSFGRLISVLDAGCGTGRYFYCLKNVERLVGVDISDDMLKNAKKPVKAAEISTGAIHLKCRDIHLATFPPESFDFIYSLGMFGNGCPVTPTLCDRFYDWLAPGGRLFFDAVDVATLPFLRRVRRRIRNSLAPQFPALLNRVLAARQGRIPFFCLDTGELQCIMGATRFRSFSVSSHICRSPLWRGTHLECASSKPFTLKKAP